MFEKSNIFYIANEEVSSDEPELSQLTTGSATTDVHRDDQAYGRVK